MKTTLNTILSVNLPEDLVARHKKAYLQQKENDQDHRLNISKVNEYYALGSADKEKLFQINKLNEINKQSDYESFINLQQRKCFSLSKYQTSLVSLTDRKKTTEKIVFDRKNLALTRVLSSMPKFKLEQLYDMKKQSIKDMLLFKNENKNPSNKYLKAKRSLESIIRPKLKINNKLREQNAQKKENSNNSKLENSHQNDNSNFNEPISMVFDNLNHQQSELSASYSLRDHNYRIKTQEELNQTIQTRIQTSQNKSNFEKPKLIVLTDKSRKNLYKIKDRLLKAFDNQEEYNEDKEFKDIFIKQNTSKNVLNFQPYFYKTYLSNNRGLQVNVSQGVNEQSQKFERNIHQMINQVDTFRKMSTNRLRSSRTINQLTIK